MKAAVAGGRLQGVEAVYLARKAGWETLVLDWDEAAPAAGLCHEFARCDLTDTDDIVSRLSGVDILIPTLEKPVALTALAEAADRSGLPLAFDPNAYATSSSKLRSDKVLHAAGLDLPAYWPECGPPVVVKPDLDSGSRGVRIVHDPLEIERLASAKDAKEGLVIQEYLPGPSYSLEVLGLPGGYVTPLVTDLFMDRDYDCKRVTAPTGLSMGLVSVFEDIGRRAASAVNLTGLMDVEVIPDGDRLKILEIDARLPSQTPTVVYLATGFNMLEGLKEAFMDNHAPDFTRPENTRAVIYEHVRVDRERVQICGEHIMGRDRLDYCRDFYGADEALTTYRPGLDSWTATLIHTASDNKTVWEKRNASLDEIVRAFGLSGVCDMGPEAHDQA